MATRKNDKNNITKSRTLQGRIINPNGEPLFQREVRAYEKSLGRKDKLVGDPTMTNREGRYTIDLNKNIGVQKDVDLYVVVHFKDKVVGTSPVILDAGPEETIDMVVGGTYHGPSRYEQVSKIVESIVGPEDWKLIDILDFCDEDFALLSAKSGIEPRELHLFRQSLRLSVQTKQVPELFFGLGVENIPLSIPAILSNTPSKRRAAIKAAIDNKQIPKGIDKGLEKGNAKLDSLAMAEVIREPELPGETTLGGMLQAGGASHAKRKELVQMYADHDGTIQEYWEKVRQSSGLSGTQVTKVQRALRLGAVTFNHLPLVHVLLKENIKTVEDLVHYEKRDWLRLIKSGGQSPVGLPIDLKAAEFTEEAYADMMFGTIERAFPTQMIAARIKDFPSPDLLQWFFERNPDFDIRSTPVDTYLEQNPNVLEELGEERQKIQLTSQLKGLIRTYNVAPDGDRVLTMQILLKDGLDSASKIRTMGKSAMMAQYEGKIEHKILSQIWNKTTLYTSLAATIIGRYHSSYNNSRPAVLPSTPAQLKKFPNYESLFGSLDFCSCAHCQSVYSPAAYLVDVLHWLNNRASLVPGETALDILFENRRADIGGIELSCKNTNTVVPYIDLVNEVLELLVSPPSQNWPGYQTTGITADLLAHPEHLHKPAYEVLAGEVYPFNLPYNLWLDEARTYLAKLGISRQKLMDVCHDNGISSAWSDTAVAAEVLMMSPIEWDIVVGKALEPHRSPSAFWGQDGRNWVGNLKKVSTFLDQATPPLSEQGMTFEELADLLRADFVQADVPVGVWFEDPTCDMSKAILTQLGSKHLGRIHRFLRLQRRLGWTTGELDRTIGVLGGGKINAAFLVKVSQLKRIMSDLRLPLDELLTWWGNLDTRRWESRFGKGVPAGAPGGVGMGMVVNRALTPQPANGQEASPYDRLFQSPTITADVDLTFGVDTDGTALQDETRNLVDHVTSVMGPLGITANDVDVIMPLVADAKLSLANLSALYRHVSLTRALDLSSFELVAAIRLTGIDPFDADLENALNFIKEVRAIRSSNFTISELDYVLRDIDTKPATLEPSNVSIGLVLLDLRDLLRKVESDHPQAVETQSVEELRSQLIAKLAMILSEADLAVVMTVIDLPASGAPLGIGGQVIDNQFSVFLDPVDAKKKLADVADAAYLNDAHARLLFVLEKLVAFLRDSGKRSAVIENMSSVLGLESGVGGPLLQFHLRHPATTGTPLIDLFISDAVRDYDGRSTEGEAVLPMPTDLLNQFAAYRRAHKAALVLNRFEITREELSWVVMQGPSLGTLDLQTLPIETPLLASAVPYTEWTRLRDAMALRKRLIPYGLFDRFVEAAKVEANGSPAVVANAYEALLSSLVEQTRWSVGDIEFLVGRPTRGGTPAEVGALGFDYPTDWKDERPLRRLEEVMKLVRRVGLPAKVLWKWRAIPLADDFNPSNFADALSAQNTQATEIKQAVRARFEVSQWHEIARPIRDKLRERQRDALAGWLIAHDLRFEDVGTIYEYLLLDTQMSSCQLTSRLKQAMSTVQLYVQRVLMSLEAQVELSSDDAREWKWMKNYRVWEANRKVFLYPENWIEPELRDDKSPFFEELEDDLLQGDVTDETAEAALLSYLTKLDDVAHLEVSAFYHQTPTDDDSTDILHVFARTHGIPHRYFYRQQIDGARWTAWEALDLDIEGNHLIPVVHNRRLYLFWPQFTVGAFEDPTPIPEFKIKGDITDGTLSNDDTPQKPRRYYKIGLFSSERRNGKWSTKKISTEQFEPNTSIPKKGRYREFLLGEKNEYYDFFKKENNSNESEFSFHPQRGLGNSLSIRVWRYKIDEIKEQKELGAFLLDGTSLFVQYFRNTRWATVARVQMNQDFISRRGELSLKPARDEESRVVFSSTPFPFRIIPHRFGTSRRSRWSEHPFFFEDRHRTFFVNSNDKYKYVKDSDDGAIIDLRLPSKQEVDFHMSGGIDVTGSGRIDSPREINVVNTTQPRPENSGYRGNLLNLQGLEYAKNVSQGNMINVYATFSDGDKDLISFKSSTSGQSPRRKTTEIAMAYQVFPEELKVTGSARLDPLKNLKKTWDGKHYTFSQFYHPYLNKMIRQLNRLGVDGMLDPSESGPEKGLKRQQLSNDFFKSQYNPEEGVVNKPFPKDEFDFSFKGAYSSYNWELFFHIPFTLATHLSNNQRFEEATRWFHFIFDPTETGNEPAPQRFWKVRPFFELFHDEDADAGPIHELLLLLQYTGSDPDKVEAREGLIAQVAEWRKNPFNPHAIARLRPTAFQKAIFMKYLDNLIEWGDQLFRQDTMESVNEATQLYTLAAQILGKRPRRVNTEPAIPRSFNQLLELGLDAFSNTLVEEVEGYLPGLSLGARGPENDDIPLIGPTLFFCVPPNEKLFTDYWDRVADRLFKLRHCMNIEGVVRQLPLFQPPIDPALLVRAAASGLDLASALSDLNSPLPLHRFALLSQKATELCTDVRGLGQSLLSALEKKDAEALSLLRSGHEIQLRSAMIEIRKGQIDEAKEAVESTKRNKENAEIRLEYYSSRKRLNKNEKKQIDKLDGAEKSIDSAVDSEAVAAWGGNFPNVSVGVAGAGGSPYINASYGGSNIAARFSANAAEDRANASKQDRAAQKAAIMGGHQRRADDWGLQIDTAKKEIEGAERQIVAAEIRVALAEKELDNLKMQIEQSKESDDFLRDKYTNKQLYQWMVREISSLYFQSYKLAYDLAKRAERAWQFELVQPDRSFIHFGYWDGLKKGLLSGDRLHHDIKRMEVAHLDANRREYELSRHVSLRTLDPVALLQLRTEGECIVRIPEAWFDLDSPGHYMRRIKTVSLSLPAVTGPYVPVRCTLTLLKSSLRTSTNIGPGYARTGLDDTRFRDDIVGLQSVVTSQGTADAGLFETNLRDERYLPFEGAGAESEWRLQLPKRFRQFDYDTISDAVLHFLYTAREGGAALKQKVEDELQNTLNSFIVGSQGSAESGQGLYAGVSARRDFGDEWARFLEPTGGADNILTFSLKGTHFPAVFGGSPIEITGVDVLWLIDDVGLADHGDQPITMSVTPPGGSTKNVVLNSLGSALGGQALGSIDYGNSSAGMGDWTVSKSGMPDSFPHPADIVLVFRYKVA